MGRSCPNLGASMMYNKFRLLVLTVLFSMVRPDTWPHCTTLDGEGKYHVCWRVLGEDEIEFRVEVETRGYVGFGLSPNGGMAGSDIVTGWVKDGRTYFQDRHGTGTVMPDMDSRQDWELVSGKENDTHTSLVFRRKLETCDEAEDMNIDNSTMRLIYAYSDEDPTSENDIQYHFWRRGTKSMLLLQQRKAYGQTPDKEALRRWDVLSPNFELKSDFTTMYWCKIHKSPEVSEKNHIVIAEPLLQPGNEQFVHHIMLYECAGGSTSHVYEKELRSRGHECYTPNMPDAMLKCQAAMVAWAVGGEDLVLPMNVGLPLSSGPSQYYMMEIHYNNPSRVQGIVDSSGLRLYYTPHLRQYDAGLLALGSFTSRRLIVPPGQPQYTVAGHSYPACLDPVMPSDGLNLLGTILHAHVMARRLKARHFRNGIELQPLGEDNNYDFNYQEYRYYTKEVNFLPGDKVTVECVYDSSDRNLTTLGGPTTREEMCFVLLLYYPRIEIIGSLSVPNADVIYDAIEKNFTLSSNKSYVVTGLDWTKQDMGKVQKKLRYGLHDSVCMSRSGRRSVFNKSVSYPENLHPFTKESACSERQFQMLSKSPALNGNFELFLSLSLFILATLALWKKL